jgi:hypothetical protein
MNSTKQNQGHFKQTGAIAIPAPRNNGLFERSVQPTNQKQEKQEKQERKTKHRSYVFDVEHQTKISGGVKMPDGTKLDDNFAYSHYAWDYTEKHRDILAQKLSSFLAQFEKDKNATKFKSDFIEYLKSNFDNKRLTVLAVQCLVCIGGFHEELKKNSVLKGVLEGCLVFDYKAQKSNYNYLYTIRNLTRGDVPDIRCKEIFEQCRKIFNFEVSISETIKIIDELEEGLEKKKVQMDDHCKSSAHKICPKCFMCVRNQECTSNIPAGSKPLCQRDFFPLICHCEHFSEKQKIAIDPTNLIGALYQQSKANLNENWRQKRIPQDKKDWEEIAKEYQKINGNLLFDNDFLKENLVIQNTDAAYQLAFSMLRPQIIEIMFDFQEKKMNERRELIEKSLESILSCIDFVGKQFEPTEDQARDMMRWVIDHLSYHPIGAFDKKHFPIYQKLDDMVHDLDLSREKRNICNVMVFEIKNYQTSKILKITHDDFFTKRLDYGPLGFVGLHKYLWETHNEQYKNTFYKKISNLCDLPPMIKAFFDDHYKTQINSGSKFFSSFLEKLQEKKKEYENEMSEKKNECAMLKNKVNELKQNEQTKEIESEIKSKRNIIRTNSERIDDLSSETDIIFETIENFENRIFGLFNKHMENVLKCLNNNTEINKADFDQKKKELVNISMECIKNYVDDSIDNVFDESFMEQYAQNWEAVENNNQEIIDHLGTEFVSLMNSSKINYSDEIMIGIISAVVDYISFVLNPHNKKETIQEFNQFLKEKLAEEIEKNDSCIHELQTKKDQGEKFDADMLFNFEETKRKFSQNKIHLIKNVNK